MMGCRLTNNITKENCAYAVAGVKELFLINYSSDIVYNETDGVITEITPPANETVVAYKVDFAENTASFTDDLAQGGNGGKYRTHTVNFTVSELEHQRLNSDADALSLGRFIAVVVDKKGKTFMLGRNNGLTATSTNYASGTADADAMGWTVVLAGSENEAMKPVKDESVIKPLYATDVVIVP